MTGDDLPGPPFPGQWGIFDPNSGMPLLAADSVYSMEYTRDYRLSDYPQEMGAFESYNKVQLPYQAKVTFSLSKARTDFMNSIEAAAQSLALVAVITPDIMYPFANITHYGYRRQKENAELVLVDVWCEEVRITGVTTTSQQQPPSNPPQSPPTGPPQSPNGSPPTNGGQPQPQPPPAPAPPPTTPEPPPTLPPGQ